MKVGDKLKCKEGVKYADGGCAFKKGDLYSIKTLDERNGKPYSICIRNDVGFLETLHFRDRRGKIVLDFFFTPEELRSKKIKTIL